MVMADGTPLVETCVLLPAEFALKVEAAPRVTSFLSLLPHLAVRSPVQTHLPSPLLDRLAPSFGPVSPGLSALSPGLGPLAGPLASLPTPAEDTIQVCATRRLPAQTRYLPFSGTVRADKLPLLPCLAPMDVSMAPAASSAMGVGLWLRPWPPSFACVVWGLAIGSLFVDLLGAAFAYWHRDFNDTDFTYA